MWLFNHLREYQPEFCGKIDYTPNKVLPSAERQEVASLAANELQSEGEMATVIEMSVRCTPALWAACCTVLRSWGHCSGFHMGRDIPELDHTMLCYGEHFNFSFESIGGVAVGISRPAIEKDVAADVTMILFTVSLHCHRAGAVRFVISLLASAKCAAEQARTPVYMAWDEENCSGVIFPSTHFDSSLHSYPLQAWERTKEIHSWAPFYRAWVNNNIIGDSLQMFCLAWVNSQSLCANNTEASVIYPASQWKLVAAPRMKSHSLRGSCPLFKG